MLKIYCALSAECAPERVHSTEVPNAALASCVVLGFDPDLGPAGFRINRDYTTVYARRGWATDSETGHPNWGPRDPG